MRSVAILGGKGGTGKTATSHLLCLGAFLTGVQAAYVLTDPHRKLREEGRPYPVLDGRLPEQAALILEKSREDLDGWLIIDGGGNRPDFDRALSESVNLTLVPFRASEEDIDTVVQSLLSMPRSLAWPSAWPTNAHAATAARYMLDGLDKAFPGRVIDTPLPFVNSISDLLASSLATPSTPTRQAARRAFDVMSECFAEHASPKEAVAMSL